MHGFEIYHATVQMNNPKEPQHEITFKSRADTGLVIKRIAFHCLSDGPTHISFKDGFRICSITHFSKKMVTEEDTLKILKGYY